MDVTALQGSLNVPDMFLQPQKSTTNFQTFVIFSEVIHRHSKLSYGCINEKAPDKPEQKHFF